MVTGGQGTTSLTVTRAYELIQGVQTAYDFSGGSCTMEPVATSAYLAGLGGGGPSISSFDVTALTLLSLAPVCYWKLNETSGSTSATDYSGNGYTLTGHGTYSFGNASVVPTDAETSWKGDGSSGYLEATTQPALIPVGTSPFTVIACVEAPIQSGGHIAVGWGPSAGLGSALGIDGAQPYFWPITSTAGAFGYAAYASKPILLGGVYDGQEASIMLNGSWLGGCSTTPSGTAGLLGIGMLNNSGTFTDFSSYSIGRVGIFAGVLTAKDWRLLMQAFTGV
jgi:hypothetical protein